MTFNEVEMLDSMRESSPNEDGITDKVELEKTSAIVEQHPTEETNTQDLLDQIGK